MPTLQTGRRPRKLSHDKIFKTLIQLGLQDFVELFERDIGPQLDFAEVQYPSGEAYAELKKAGHLQPDFVARVGRRDARPPVLLNNLERQYVFAQVVENYLILTDEESVRYRAALAQEKQAMVPFPLTFAEALDEHEARGIAVGEVRATRESIVILLERRFGAAPATLRSKLSAISELARLREILARVIEVRSLDQLEASLA